ncbi:MAG: hypothetical protein LQ346_002616 [Caloplaca aetnensis]|nr:MAG: hypothetical protein LQ346_002616 [Caloplaca aetnensis]
MASVAIPRFLLPRRGELGLQQTRLILRPSRRRPQSCRHASSAGSPSKQRVLEKPTKFYPPSHPQRLAKRKVPRQYAGPPLSEAQREAQKVKKYPNMMPAEGTFMYWFLNSHLLHMSITLTVLFSLASVVFVEDFHRSTPYLDMLPPGKEFWSHPFKFVATYGHVYKLHTDYVSAETAEKRKKKADDMDKRSRYRKAHGLENELGFEGWTEPLGSALSRQDKPDRVEGPSGDKVVRDAAELESKTVSSPAEGSYVDFEGKRRPIKRWLGIWE